MKSSNTDQFTSQIYEQVHNSIKYFVYKNKKYHFDFSLFKKNSNYFYNNRNLLKNVETINLLNECDDSIEIPEEAIHAFISSCQNEECNISRSIVIPLQFLSYKFEVPQLIEITNEIVRNNFDEIFFQSFLFKIQFQNCDKKVEFFDTKSEEEAAVARLKECINDERMFQLPISILDRIFHKYFFDSKSGIGMNSKSENKLNSTEIIEFLFKCLDRYGRDASILFSYVDFEQQSIGVVDRLLKQYSEIFDFNVINSTLLKTTMMLTSEVTRVKEECLVAFNEMKNQFDSQKKEMVKFCMSIQKKQKEAETRNCEREQKLENELNRITKINKENDEVFQLFENMKKNPTPDDFNNYFTNELKMNFIRDVIKNRSVDDGKEKSLLVERILFCISLYDNVSLDAGSIEFISKNIQKLSISHEMIDKMWENNVLLKFLSQSVSIFNDILIEIRYPSDNFEKIKNTMLANMYDKLSISKTKIEVSVVFSNSTTYIEECAFYKFYFFTGNYDSGLYNFYWAKCRNV